MKAPSPVANYGSPFERAVDSFVGVFSPRARLSRMDARAALNAKLSYDGARSGRDREPPQFLNGPDYIGNQMDSVTMLRRAQDLGRDSAFIGAVVRCFQRNVTGKLMYIPNVGTKKQNEQYRIYINNWMLKNSDVTQRFTFREQMNYGLGGTFFAGDHGFIHHHHEDGSFQIQNIVGEMIGNPRQIITNKDYIRGVEIRDGVPVAYHLFQRTPSEQYIRFAIVPAAVFTHLNPVESADEYKAKTPFHAVLNDAHDFLKIEKAWIKKIQWAGYKVGVINSANGAFPDANPVDEGAAYGGPSVRPKLQPFEHGEVIYGDSGTKIELVDNQTPSQNEVDLLMIKMQQIASAVDLPLAVVWIMMGLPGTYTRTIVEWANGTYKNGPRGQGWLRDKALNPIIHKAIFSGIIRGEIPWTKDWDRGTWFFPPDMSPDAGNEADADREDLAAGITSMREILGKRQVWWGDTVEENANEATEKITLAIEISKTIKAETGVDVDWQDCLAQIGVVTANGNPTAKQPEAPTTNTLA